MCSILGHVKVLDDAAGRHIGRVHHRQRRVVAAVKAHQASQPLTVACLCWLAQPLACFGDSDALPNHAMGLQGSPEGADGGLGVEGGVQSGDVAQVVLHETESVA